MTGRDSTCAAAAARSELFVNVTVGDVIGVKERLGDDVGSECEAIEVDEVDEVASVWDKCSVECPIARNDVGAVRDILC